MSSFIIILVSVKKEKHKLVLLLSAFSPQKTSCFSVIYLSFCNKVGHDRGVSELGGQMDAAAALAVDQRRVCTVFHELHHHG